MAEARERLKHGKSLCGKVFRRFVETFNWLVDFSSNLRGDGEQGGSGQLVLDRTDEKHPVIRCKGCVKGEEERSSSVYPQAFDIKNIDENEVVFTNCYFQIGGMTHYIEDLDDGEYRMASINVKGKIVACHSGNGESASFGIYVSISDMNSAQENRNNFIRPLYWFNEDMSVKMDFRSMPDFGQWEAE